jgi:hypothetical protein
LTVRLEGATRVELNRLCIHLGLQEHSTIQKIKETYIDAADNSILNILRPVISNAAPTYHRVLAQIYKELRSYSEARDETWNRVKKLKIWDYTSPIDEMDELELEDKILSIYKAKYLDAKDKLKADPTLWIRFAEKIPGVVLTGAGTASTVVVQSAARAPFAALGPSALAGPVGIALGVIMVGTQLAGPAFRKIIPATVELILIGQRIENTPKE